MGNTFTFFVLKKGKFCHSDFFFAMAKMKKTWKTPFAHDCKRWINICKVFLLYTLKKKKKK